MHIVAAPFSHTTSLLEFDAIRHQLLIAEEVLLEVFRVVACAMVSLGELWAVTR